MAIALFDYQIFALGMIVSSVSVLLGHALGYWRARDASRRPIINQERQES